MQSRQSISKINLTTDHKGVGSIRNLTNVASRTIKENKEINSRNTGNESMQEMENKSISNEDVKVQDPVDKFLANNPGNKIRQSAIGIDLSDIE